ncbi:MAG: hydroxylamine oxidation protein HaoB [Burkholderiales bacterium]|nr:hydroxylamine oxidation protein HaoB [Burkholderiales bacterium]
MTGAAAIATVAGAPASPQRWLARLAWLLFAVGIALLAWAAWGPWGDAPAPYRYRVSDEGDAGRAQGLQGFGALQLQRVELHADGIDQPLAVGHIARRAGGAPVMVDWDNASGEPLAHVDTRAAELAGLADAVREHVPEGALLLAWWDTARALALLTGRRTPFDAWFGEPFIAPSPWLARRSSIEAEERAFWGAPPSQAQSRDFRRFAEALASDERAGAQALRELAGGRQAFLVVHVSDLFKLGRMLPQQLGVATKDFPLRGDLHGPIVLVKRWMQEQRWSGYTVHEPSDRIARATFVTDARSAQTLLARLLPLTSSAPLEMRDPELVYQHGGYWVYRIAPAAPRQ